MDDPNRGKRAFRHPGPPPGPPGPVVAKPGEAGNGPSRVAPIPASDSWRSAVVASHRSGDRHAASPHKSCPKCGNAADGKWSYISLHKCRACESLFCDTCKNGERCPYPACSSSDIWWKYDESYRS